MWKVLVRSSGLWRFAFFFYTPHAIRRETSFVSLILKRYFLGLLRTRLSVCFCACAVMDDGTLPFFHLLLRVSPGAPASWIVGAPPIVTPVALAEHVARGTRPARYRLWMADLTGE